MGLRAGFFKEEAMESKIQNTLSRALYHFSISVVIESLESAPSAPPRAFPLWLLAPRCLGIRTAQILGIEPFGFFSGRGSFLSPGRALCLLAESALAIPTPRFANLCLVSSFRFREIISMGTSALII
jgi:hypothetical protein